MFFFLFNALNIKDTRQGLESGQKTSTRKLNSKLRMAGFQHSPADGARFKSEMFVPVRQDSNSFEERQRNMWDEMHERMDRRRKEWDEEVRTI